MKLPSVSIIGTGSLGTALARALHKKGFPIKSLFNSTVLEAEKLSRSIGARSSGSFPVSADELGELVFLTVPDGRISDVALSMSELKTDYTGSTFAHCSGNETSELLFPLKKKGASTAALHPLQTFTEFSDAGDFEGIYFNLEGDKEAKKQLKDLAELLDAKVFEVSRKQKPYLHASAVFVSNYLVALLKGAEELAGLGGMDGKSIRKALLPLVEKTLENGGTDELGEVLTGPIARGDVATVKKHLELLDGTGEEAERLRTVYKVMGSQALSLARLDDETAEELKLLLDTHG